MTATDRRPGQIILLRYVSALYKPALAAVTYYAAAKLAFLIGTLSDRIFAPFWPPNVVLLCVLLLAPARRWPVYFGAIFIAHAAAEAAIGMPGAQMLLAFATNCSVAFIGAAMLRITTAPPWLGSARSAALYILITAGIAPAVAAFGAVVGAATGFLLSAVLFIALGPDAFTTTTLSGLRVLFFYIPAGIGIASGALAVVSPELYASTFGGIWAWLASLVPNEDD